MSKFLCIACLFLRVWSVPNVSPKFSSKNRNVGPNVACRILETTDIDCWHLHQQGTCPLNVCKNVAFSELGYFTSRTGIIGAVICDVTSQRPLSLNRNCSCVFPGLSKCRSNSDWESVKFIGDTTVQQVKQNLMID